ncbi:MAG TPA: hypothetical protein EYF98_10765 [Planctomycetes bacterium]|nr:hypothetical protein [Planctomycetota bacterium]
MSHLDLSTLAGGSIPRWGVTPFLGTWASGSPAALHTLIQFMNGAPIVDYGSISVDTIAGANGKVSALDSRAGDKYLTPTTGTSGYTPHVVETWTFEFQSATTFDMIGSVSGTQGTFNCDADAIVKDLIYTRIESGASIDWVGKMTAVAIDITSGDPVVLIADTTGLEVGYPVTGAEIAASTTILSIDPNVSITLSNNPTGTNATGTLDMAGDSITVNFINNPNNSVSSPGTQWLDPEPFATYLGSDNVWPEETDIDGRPDMRNYRPLFIDAGGVADPADYVYMALMYYAIDSSPDLQNWGIQGMTGWSADGNHPTPSGVHYLFMPESGEIFGNYICDQFRFTAAVNYQSKWNMCHAGLINPFRTKEEYAYPFHLFANNNAPIKQSTATVTSYSSLVASYYRDCGQHLGADGIWRSSIGTGTTNMAAQGGIGRLDPLTSAYSTRNRASYVGVKYAPPRSGDSQIPIMPITCSNFTATGIPVIGQNPHCYLDNQPAGEVRGVWCTGVQNGTDGDILTINGVDYLLVRGFWGPAVLNDRFYRLAIRLA